ncbi:MAG: hypothetical protein SGJ11_06860 [Phycisphaerae bacterium]|nr:hypothetical protein [Phycisphaerae bacterium]
MPALVAPSGSSTSSLAALAEWVQSLPLESLAPVGILFVAGLLLLTVGQRLLKPVLVIAAIFAGVVVAVRVGSAIQPTVSPLIWSVIGAVAGVIFVAVSYRVVLGLAVALIGAVIAMLVATTAAELGWVNVGPQPTSSGLDSGLGVYARPAPPKDDFTDPRVEAAELLRQATATTARDAVTAQLDEVSPGLGPKVSGWLDRLNGFLASAGEWVHERWKVMPTPMRTLLLASGAAGGFIGFIAGIASPAWAAAVVTSLFGGLLVLGCGLPLATRVVPPDSIPDVSPLAWLVTWLVIAMLGWSFQWWTRPAAQRRRKRTLRAETEDAA